jgi:hypothetical protein
LDILHAAIKTDAILFDLEQPLSVILVWSETHINALPAFAPDE